MSLEKYRPTMTEDVLHSWASEAQAKITELMIVVNQMRDSVADKYQASPEGRDYLEKIDKALSL